MDAFWQWLESPLTPLPRMKATPVNESNNSTVSFDRMRTMLTRAAEIRESEQQQIFDALDEIHARMSPLDAIGSMRKRLSELPDRTETSVLAERLDEAMAKLEAQDTAIQAMTRAVDGIVDKLAKPFAQLDGRLEGVAGRFEGVAGRMDGLEDKLSNIHRRLDELELHLDKQDTKVEALPSAVHGPVRDRIESMETVLRARIDEVDEGVHEHLDGAKDTLQRSVTETRDSVQKVVTEGREGVQRTVAETAEAVQAKVGEHTENLRGAVVERADSLHGKLDGTHAELQGKLDETRQALQAALDEARETVDASERLEGLAGRLEQVTSRLDEMATRLDTVEDGFTARLKELGGTIEQSLSQVHSTLSHQPDSESVTSLVRKSNEETERRIGGHLDEAMATFAELMLGGGTPPPPPPTTLPRQGRRRNAPKNGKGSEKSSEENDIAEGA
jgi:chromosome segregation ATPase